MQSRPGCNDFRRLAAEPAAAERQVGSGGRLDLRFSANGRHDWVANPMAALQEILHYTGYPHDRGGIVAVLRALQSAGRFRVVHGVGADFRATGAPLDTWIGPGRTSEQISVRDLWRTRADARAVRTWLGGNPRRIFHGHSRAGLLVALWLNFWGEQRVIVTVHCYGRQRRFYRWAARRLGERLFWLSPAMKKYYGVGDGSWAQCVPACAIAPTVPGSRVPRVDGGIVRLGGIGALVPWKNWHLLLEALALLPSEIRRRLRFSHIGSSNGSTAGRAYEELLHDRTIAAGLTDSVHWLGQQAAADAFLPEVDCLVVPSHNEPFSVALLEALVAGVPVMAADSGGTVDIIEPGRNGWLFKSGDASDLAKHLAALVDGGALANIRIDPARLVRFAAPAVADLYAKEYEKLVGP